MQYSLVDMADKPQRSVAILPVKDMGTAIDFYKSLGFSAERYQNGDGYAFLDRGGFELHLNRIETLVREHNPCGVYFYLERGTSAALESEFRAAGVRLLSPLAPREWKMNEFVLEDPDGNLLRFGEPLN